MKRSILLILLLAAAVSIVIACGCGVLRSSHVRIIESAAEPDTTSLGIGKWHLAKKQYPDAVRHFKEAVEQEPKSWEAHLFLGRAYGEVGRMDSARHEFWQAMGLASSPTQEKAIVRAMRSYRHKHAAEDQVGGCAPVMERFDIFDVYPEVIKDARPKYPKSARESEVEGAVTVTVTIGRSGTVIEACIKETSAPVLNRAALEAAKEFQFTPAKLNGIAVISTVDIPFRWSLTD